MILYIVVSITFPGGRGGVGGGVQAGGYLELPF